MLPFQPEPLADLWVAVQNMNDRPGLHRENVFDFEDGLRLIISKDRLFSDPKENVHLSASWTSKERAPTTWADVDLEVIKHYQSIGGPGLLQFIGASSGNVPHWVVLRLE